MSVVAAIGFMVPFHRYFICTWLVSPSATYTSCWCFFSMYTYTAKTLTSSGKITLIQYGAKPNIKHALSIYINFIVSMVALICMCGVSVLQLHWWVVVCHLEHQHHHTCTHLHKLNGHVYCYVHTL